MDSFLEFFGDFAVEFFGEVLSGVLVSSGQSVRDAFSKGGCSGSLFGQSPWWRS